VCLPDFGALSVLGGFGVAAAAAVAGSLALLAAAAWQAPAAGTAALLPQTAPLVLGIMAFVYAGHGTFPGVRANMAQPSRCVGL
jgi:hypothetical protein